MNKKVEDKTGIVVVTALVKQIISLCLHKRFYSYHVGHKNHDNEHEECRTREMNPMKVAQLIFFSQIIINALTAIPQRTHMKRDIYYIHKEIFGSETKLTNLTILLCQTLQCPRHSLGILSISKGVFIGNFEYKKRNDISWNLCASKESSVPSDAVKLNDYEFKVAPKLTKPRFILLVEKLCIFQQIQQQNFHQTYNFILVTGRGFSDLNTRAWLKNMQQKLDLKVFGICDFNPFGISLMLNHITLTQNKNSYPEIANYILSDFELVGVNRADADYVPKIMLQTNSQNDIKLIHKLLGKYCNNNNKENNTQNINEIIENLKYMLKTGIKFEIENIGSDFLIDTWFPELFKKISTRVRNTHFLKRKYKSANLIKNIYGILI